jgi:hypothetical protein
MNDESPPEPTAPENKPAPEQDQASLTDALDQLENLLDTGAEGTRPTETAQAGGDGDQIAQGQYTIPLLSEVVSPGPSGPLEAERESPTQAHSLPPLAEDPASQELIRRLASEIEVIVHTAVDEAVGRAHAAIRDQVQQHLDIVLPEIVEEIVERQTRSPR